MKIKRHIIRMLAAAVAATLLVAADQRLELGLFSFTDWGTSRAQPAPGGTNPSGGQAQKPAEQAGTQSGPRRTETINYDSWTLTCSESMEKNAKKTCSGTLRVIEQKQGQVLFVWIIGRDSKGVMRTVMRTPTGVQITKGVELKLGKAQMRTLPYTACTQQQCDASIPVDDALVNDMVAAPEATATIYAIDGRDINFNMPIKSVEKVFAAIGR
jgi:invasion protein IalB